MQAFNIEKGLMQVNETLYNSLVYTVLLDNPTEAFFDTTVGDIKGAPLCWYHSTFFLETFMQETLDNYHTSISISGRSICSLHFADDIINIMVGTNG